MAIDEIVENDHIAGHVVGLSSAVVDEYKVVVYVHTNQWYIHPYAGQSEGSSWASISSTLKWNLGSVRREAPADQVAALLVKANVNPPATMQALGAVRSVCWVVVAGNGQI
jgi:hypothetical protein